VISGFRRNVAENCALQGPFRASSGNFSPTFRYDLSVLPSEFKNKKTKPSQDKPSQAKSRQAKVLNGGGDLRKAQVDVPLSVSHSCF